MAETRAQELARGWPTVLAAATGVGLGVAGLLTYNSGLFAHDLAIQAGVSRTMFGAAMGAEADLVGILTARYFGIAAYSRAYAVQYAAFMLAAGVSPLWIGYSVDASGGYQLPLIICASFLIIPILLFLQLPKLQRSTKWTANLAI